ncbi:hypothetical protein GCM10027402_35520 [Arthrobacter monumenti]
MLVRSGNCQLPGFGEIQGDRQRSHDGWYEPLVRRIQTHIHRLCCRPQPYPAAHSRWLIRIFDFFLGCAPDTGNGSGTLDSLSYGVGEKGRSREATISVDNSSRFKVLSKLGTAATAAENGQQHR